MFPALSKHARLGKLWNGHTRTQGGEHGGNQGHKDMHYLSCFNLHQCIWGLRAEAVLQHLSDKPMCFILFVCFLEDKKVVKHEDLPKQLDYSLRWAKPLPNSVFVTVDLQESNSHVLWLQSLEDIIGWKLGHSSEIKI